MCLAAYGSFGPFCCLISVREPMMYVLHVGGIVTGCIFVYDVYQRLMDRFWQHFCSGKRILDVFCLQQHNNNNHLTASFPGQPG